MTDEFNKRAQDALKQHLAEQVEQMQTPEAQAAADALFTGREASCTDPFCAEHSPLMNAPVQFWSCPVDEHRDRRGVVTVEWREGVAHCTAPDCERTSRG